MKRVLVIVLILAGVAGLALAGLILIVGAARWAGKERVPAATILEANLEAGFPEEIPDDPVAAALLRGTSTLRDFVEGLERAGDDDRVAGLVARIGGGAPGLAGAQEIRDAVLAFREKGKFAVAFSETFGEVGPGSAGYYMATAFDEIWLQPSGDVNLIGLLAEPVFVRGTLDKLGIKPQMDQRHVYKNAMNTLTDTEMTPAFEEALGKVIRSMFGQMVAGIARDRDMSEEELLAIMDSGPRLGAAAADAGLVDGVAYRDEVYDKVRERAGEGARLLYVSKYLERAGRPHDRGDTIALVYGVGAVTRGKSTFNPLTGQTTMGSDTVAGALRAAIDDEDVVAILFRVDSPGGSYVASDTIWRETVRAREAGKPLIVSMSNVAGSGGYFVAMDADKVVAHPATITGSIGVLGGKFNTTGFWEWLGISTDDIRTSAQSTLYSSSFDYTPEEWRSFQAWLDRVYDDFTGKVAQGRGLPLERVREIAKGRIWSGEDARDIGLVDELGGFGVALRLAREAAGLSPGDPVRLRKFPPEKSLWEKLTGDEPDSSEAVVSEATLQLLRQLQPAARQVEQMALPPGSRGVLSMPPLPEIR